MKFLSVCSGIEAVSVAWKDLPFEAAAFAEIEPFPCAVLAHHYPEVPNVGDFTSLKGDEFGTIDILVGGTPCQSFSVAGKRGGLDDARGNLALEFAALAHRSGAKWVLWENVPGVLSSGKGEDFGRFLHALSGVDLSVPPKGWKTSGVVAGLDGHFSLAWRVLDAQHFGVPQRRRRVFVVGHLGDWRRAASVLLERESLCGNPEKGRKAGEEIAGTLGSHAKRGSFRYDLDGSGAYIPEIVPQAMSSKWAKGSSGPAGDEIANLVAFSETTDCLYSAYGTKWNGNAAAENGSLFVGEEPIAIRTANTGANGHGIAENVSHTLDGANGQAIAFSQNQAGDILSGEVMHALGTNSNASGRNAPTIAFVQNSRDEVRLFGGDGQSVGSLSAEPGTKQQCYIACDLADSLTVGANQTYGFTGDIVGFQSSQSGVREVENHATLDSNNGSRRHNGVVLGSRVRRLTPLECERLQGFPDNYTAINNAKDTPRYKAIGNSMAVPVIRWIGERILKYGEKNANRTEESPAENALPTSLDCGVCAVAA